MNKELYNEVKEKLQSLLNTNSLNEIGDYLKKIFEDNLTVSSHKSIYKAVYEISTQNTILENYVSWSKEGFSNLYKNKLDSVMIDKIISDPFELDTIISMGSDTVFDNDALTDIYNTALNIKNVAELSRSKIDPELQSCIDKLALKLGIKEEITKEAQDKEKTNKEYNDEIQRLNAQMAATQAEKDAKNKEKIVTASDTFGVSEDEFKKQMNKNGIDVNEIDSYVISDDIVDKAAANSAIMTRSDSDLSKLIANIKNKNLLKNSEIIIEDSNVIFNKKDTKADVVKQVVVKRTTDAKAKIASVSKPVFNHMRRKLEVYKEKLNYVGKQVNELVSKIGLSAVVALAVTANTIDDAIEKMSSKMKEIDDNVKEKSSLLNIKVKNWEADKLLKASEKLEKRAKAIKPNEDFQLDEEIISGRSI